MERTKPTVSDLRARKSAGTIVNILSINTHCGAPDLAFYAATKGALPTLTKNAAHANLSKRIRVNGIILGWVNTPKEHQMQSDTFGRGDAWLNEEISRMPLGKLLESEDAERLAVYLLSDTSVPTMGVAIDLNQRVTGAPA
jgi:NAD(P)-dependent dehydrogenase (short-subunit alcohol dehydrogenase family)